MPRLSARRHPIDHDMLVIERIPGNTMAVPIREARDFHSQLGDLLAEHDAPPREESRDGQPAG